MTIKLVQGDLSPVIELVTEGADLAGKTLQFWLTRVGTCEPIKLDAFLQDNGSVQVPLTFVATEHAGTFYGDLVVVGEQTVYERLTIVIRSRCA